MIDIERKISAVSYNNKNMPLAIQEKEIQPTTEEQVITGDDGYNLSKVTIKAVTKDIDSNIQSQNIKNGITILGVTGVLAGNKLPDVLNKTVTTLTAGDLIGTTQIPNYAFENCIDLTSVEFPSILQTIGNYAFQRCSKLTSVDIPSSVTSIGNYAFQRCSKLTSVDIPSSVTSIGNSAFSNCSNLTSINIPDSVTSISSSAFYNCSSLTSINIPDSVTSIGSLAFSGCSSLTSINIPDSVTSIDFRAFEDCSSLTSITIPNSVTSIGSNAFNSCIALLSVTYLGQAPNIVSNIFYSCNAIIRYDFRNCTAVPRLTSASSLGHADGCEIIIPDVLYDEWITATNWVSLTNVTFVKASEANA